MGGKWGKLYKVFSNYPIAGLWYFQPSEKLVITKYLNMTRNKVTYKMKQKFIYSHIYPSIHPYSFQSFAYPFIKIHADHKSIYTT